MNSSNEPLPDSLLQFVCHECHIVFQALPDDTGYEQAPCPHCNYVCMTVEFERGEADRNGNEANVASLFGLVSGALGFGFHVPRQGNGGSYINIGTVVSVDDAGEAAEIVELLANHDIPAKLRDPGESPGMIDVVTTKDLCRQAIQLLKANEENS